VDAQKLPEETIRIQRALNSIRAIRILTCASVLLALTSLGVGCATHLPEPKMTRYAFPKGKAFVGDVKRPYKKLGQVRTKVNFNTLDWIHEEDQLCRNYYNKAARDLVARADDQGADAVIDIQSVVFNDLDGAETYPTPECSDEGQEGQILLQGVAVKWVRSDASH
jgi:hypothetical protein